MTVPRSQPYRISWPANVKISPELQKALGQQFANIDECLQLIFSLLREDSVATIRSVASASHDPIVMMLGDAGNDGDDGVPGATGATGATGPMGAMIAQDGNDGEDGMPGPQGPQGATGTTGATGAAGADGAAGTSGAVGPLGPPGQDWAGDEVASWPVPIHSTDGVTGSGAVVLASSPTLSNPLVGTQGTSDNSTKAASTAYVTTAIANAVAGVNPAVAVQAATTAASDTSGFTYNNGVAGIGAFFTGSVNTAVTIDGYTFTALGQRLLVKNDTQSPSGAFNGVYYVTQVQTAILAPILTRALDYDMPSDINNTGAIPVVNGTVNAQTSWLLTSQVTTIGTDPLTYIQFSINPTKLLTSALTSAHLLVGNGSNLATDTVITGDVTISNAGVTAIGALKVVGSMIASLPNPITQDILFTDATYDIGKSGATRPRDVFTSRKAVVGTNFSTGGQFEVGFTNPGIALNLTRNPGAAGDDGFVAGFGYDSAGSQIKLGATAFQWTDTNTTSGYASWNVHTSAINGGVQSDIFNLAAWGKNGITFFPADLTASSAPGASDVVMISNGRLLIGTGPANPNAILEIKGTYTGLSTFAPKGFVVQPLISIPIGLNAFGFDIASGFTKAASGTHTNIVGGRFEAFSILGSGATVTNASIVKIEGPQSGGTNNYSLWCTGGGIRFESLGAFVASDKYVVIDSNGNLHVSALGPAS